MVLSPGEEGGEGEGGGEAGEVHCGGGEDVVLGILGC